jgi:sporulation-control protein
MAELDCEMPEAILKLDRTHIPAGEKVTGSFLFWREIVERTDNAIDIEFVRRAQIQDEVIEQKLEEFRTETFFLDEESQTVKIPFSYQLPQWLPVSTHAIRYYLRPKLPAVSECDTQWDELAGLHALIVQPNADQTRLFHALSELGFQEKLDSRGWNGIAQQFHFTSGKRFASDIHELTILFQADKNTAHVQLILDQAEPVRFALSEDQDLYAVFLKTLHL